MGSKSCINNSCGRLSEESTTPTYFCQSIKIEMMSFSYDMVLKFIYKKEAEMWLRESDFLQRYSLDWEAYDQKTRVENLLQ